MPINPLNHHYAMENPASIYDEEAMTALELAGRTAKKVNEVVQAQNELQQKTEEHDTQVDHRLDQQDQRIERIQNEVVPNEIVNEMERKINDGSFDQAISNYAGNLTQRVDNLFGNMSEGGTALDAEVIDARLDIKGLTHSGAGVAIRHQVAGLDQKIDETSLNSGVYTLKIPFVIGNSFKTEPFPIPKDGLSVRVSDFGPYTVNGKTGKLMCSVDLGYITDDGFSMDNALSKQYGGGVFTNRINYVPYMEGVYVKVYCTLIANGSNILTSSTLPQATHLLEKVKIYTGKVTNGGNHLGVCMCTVLVDTSLEEDEKEQQLKLQWAAANWVYKYSALATPLPLKYVNRVTCSPDMWLGAKVYKFDPITRKRTWVRTMHFNEHHPCFGSECVLDFTEYGDDYWASVIFGRAPYYHEYGTTGFEGGTTGTSNVQVLGLNPDLAQGVHIDWVNENKVQVTRPVMSPALQQNIELLKGLKHKVVAGKSRRDPDSRFRYTLPQDDFAGTFYAGTYIGGSLFYHISPATYYTALLNPNSCAYGSVNINESGRHYGTVCSVFCSLLHGYPMPLSVQDMRYNTTIPWMERKRLDLRRDLHTLKGGDILTYGSGGTGHSAMLAGITTVGNMLTCLNIMESVDPATRDTIWCLHNGPNFIKSDAENYYQDSYTYVQVTDPAYDQTLADKANWIPAYTEPQKVMCSRGYGSVYIRNLNTIHLSVDPNVTEITITQDGATVGTYNVEDLTIQEQNGYNLVDITGLVSPGTIRVRNNLDDGVEEFHLLDVSHITVTAELTDSELIIRTNHPEQVKFVNVHYRFIEGDHQDQAPNACFMPNFVGNEMRLPATMDSDLGKMDMFDHVNHGVDFRDYVNVIFKTDYDTNTFTIDAQGDCAI